MGQEYRVEHWNEGTTGTQGHTNHHQAMDCESPLHMVRLLRHTRPYDEVTHDLKRKLGLQQLIGESPAFLAQIRKLPAMARCDATVLITGETGTGKEVCARAIHYLSGRADKPFIAVNCGAIPTELTENELFGHERGAYTDAGNRGRGLIAEADGGTLFLDEIDCLPLLAQVKLLRFLQEKEYRPLGSTKTTKASVRVIAATNANPTDAVHQGTLRRDLYYRINILPLALPPLRDRPEDIALLAQHFLAKFAAEFAKPVAALSPAVLRVLQAHAWPGNVRELEHTIERAVALTDAPTIDETDLALATPPSSCSPESFHTAKARAVAQFEQTYLKDILVAHAGNITKAARAAGKNRRAFWQLLRKHGIDACTLKEPQPAHLDKG